MCRFTRIVCAGSCVNGFGRVMILNQAEASPGVKKIQSPRRDNEKEKALPERR
jgi:hypothetical protein